MKKTYIAPMLDVVKIQTVSMLAASTTSVGFSGTPAPVGDAVGREDDGYDW